MDPVAAPPWSLSVRSRPHGRVSGGITMLIPNVSSIVLSVKPYFKLFVLCLIRNRDAGFRGFTREALFVASGDEDDCGDVIYGDVANYGAMIVACAGFHPAVAHDRPIIE